MIPPKKFLLIVVVVTAVILLVGIAVYFVLKQDKERLIEPEPEVVVRHTDLGKAVVSQDKLPPGFPAEIPVELENVTESYSAAYKEPVAVQYTVSYLSSKSKDEKYQEYMDYMRQDGYEINQVDQTSQVNSVYGTKNNNDLLVVISSQAEFTLIQLSYLARQ